MIESRQSAAHMRDMSEVEGASAFFCSMLATLILFVHLGSALGPIVPVVSLGSSVTIFVLARRRAGAHTRRFLWLMAFPLLALLSAAWSQAPSTTAYYAAQLVVTFLGAAAIWFAGAPRAFVRQLFAASLAICIVSVASGKTGPSVTGPVLVGITGSKNAMAAVAQGALFSGLALLVDRRQGFGWRMAGAAAVPVGGWIVAATHAATIILLTLLAPVLVVAIRMLRACPGKVRPFLAISLGLALLGAGSVAGTLTQRAEDYTLEAFNKDKGLTGRTYLWAVAEQKIAERPWQGYGYKAFWMSGSVDSIGLLRSQRIADPRTFSLHQTYLEVWLDTGIGGVLIVAGTFAASLVASWVAVFRRGGVPEYFIAVSIACLVVRSFGDTLFQPFYAYGTITAVLAAFALFGENRPDTTLQRNGRTRRFYRRPVSQPEVL